MANFVEHEFTVLAQSGGETCGLFCSSLIVIPSQLTNKVVPEDPYSSRKPSLPPPGSALHFSSVKQNDPTVSEAMSISSSFLFDIQYLWNLIQEIS